jgi:predicted GNAT superfamily acetyltransferase
MAEPEMEIRRAETLEDYNACVALQSEVWTLSTSADMATHLASTAILKVATENGGAVLVAAVNGNVIGFSFAMMGRRIWWSHMTAVRAEYRSKMVGLKLKIRQREEALRNGIEEIHWTFDPLQALNAHFNFNKLGVIVRHHEENVYGVTASALHHGLPTDRFIAQWVLNSQRVRDRVNVTGGAVILRDLDRLPRINSTHSDSRLGLQDELLLLEIPTDLQTVDDPRAWQKMIADVCRHYFSTGYVITDFFRIDCQRPQALYLLSRTSALL